MCCVTPPAAAYSALLSYHRPADASTTAHPECLRVQMCLHAWPQHCPCSSEHAAMLTAEPCLLASLAAPSCCLRAAPSGHPFAAGGICMTRQAQSVIDKCNFLCDVLSCKEAVVLHVHDRMRCHQPTPGNLFNQGVLARYEAAVTPHMKIFLGFIPHGPMDKASAYGAEDSRFDPWCGSLHFCHAGRPIRA